MDAPFYEIVVRVVVALVSLFAFSAVFTLWRVQIEEKHPVRYLTCFMTGVLFALLLDRLYIVWIGLQNDTDGSYARDVEPLLRAFGASLLGLVLLGAGLVAVFYIKHRELP